MLNAYWPSEVNIDKCIRAEAEELSDQVLFSVHEPMELVRTLSEINQKEEFKNNAEDALLKNLMSSSRPIPILGDSGSGKSHLIRWLDIKLKTSEETKNWIVRRIPKSASLREVLNILLDGLEGEIFDKARDQIDDVGKTLKTRDIAEHLIVCISSKLKDRYDDMMIEKQELLESGEIISPAKKASMTAINKHAKHDKLPALLGDSNYKKTLLNEKTGCIYQIAKRLTSGSNSSELEQSNYSLKAEDLDFNLNLQDLSSDAQTYVSRQQLNTLESNRIEAVTLLNSVLSDACNNVFQQFFKLHGGNFLDLFIEIRKCLKGKVLVILVEDMSLITAIESDLITSLTREGRRDGEEQLCEIKSVLAVTTGYEGYLKHRNSIIGRNSGYEWSITKTIDDSHSLYERFEDFCGRYINSARHGEKNLSLDLIESENYIWRAGKNDVDIMIDDFGVSKSGFPLFPFNKPALRAYADKLCKSNSSGEITFNPRLVLKHVLIENLTSYRKVYLEGRFPPIGLGEIECTGAMSSELKKNIHSNLKRAESFSAIWGYGAKTLSELASLISPNVANEFGFSELGEALENITPSSVKISEPRQKIQINKGKTPQPRIETEETIDEKVELWFKKKDIPQDAAKKLRKFLCDAFEKRVSNYKEWNSIQGLPKVVNGTNYEVYIPYNVNNPKKSLLSLELKNKKISEDSGNYKVFIIAVLKFCENGDWSYPEGFSDRCIAENFLSEWLPESITMLVEQERQSKLQNLLREHIKLAYTLEPSLQNKSITEKISFLCQQNEDRKTGDRKLLEKYPDTGIEDWDSIKNTIIEQWDSRQNAWLKLVSINNHALVGDSVKKAMRGISIEVFSEASTIQKIYVTLQRDLICLRKFEDIFTKEDFELTLQKLASLITKMGQNNQYLGMEGHLTARMMKLRIDKIIDSNCWESVKASKGLFEPFEVLKVVSSLQGIKLEHLNLVKEVVDCFESVFKKNHLRMGNENKANGGEARQEKQSIVSKKLDLIGQNLNMLSEKGTYDE